MKVLVIANNYFPILWPVDGPKPLGGMENAILCLIDELLSQGDSVDLMATDDSDLSGLEQRYGERVKLLPLGGKSRSNNNGRQLLWRIRRRKRTN